MKKVKSCAVMLALVFFTLNTQAQKIKTTEGSTDGLKNETSINIEFTYDNITIGKKAEKEEDYIKRKKEDYNGKEPGRGDSWEKAWKNDRAAKFEPSFNELFTKTSGMTISKDAKYTLIFKTKTVEPGYNIAGGMMIGGRKNAEIDADVWIVETTDRTKKIAVITVENAPGRTFSGYDYATGDRISEAYEVSGKKLAKYIK